MSGSTTKQARKAAGLPGRAAAALALVALAAAGLRADAVGLPELPGLPPLPGAYAAPEAPQAAVPASATAQTQAELADLLEQERKLNASETTMDKAINKVIQATGLHLDGDAVVQAEDMLVLPSDPLGMYAQDQALSGGAMPTQFNLHGANGAQRIVPVVGYFDLDITARPTQDISGEVVYRMEKIFGEFWGQGDIAGVRWFNLHGDTPVGFDLGDFYYTDTPLTFWVPEDEYAFEPQLLAMKRQEGMEDAQIQGNSFPLQGGKLDGTLLLFNHLDLTLTGLGIRTAVAGNPNTSLPFGVIYPYDQYLFGGTARFSGEHDKAFSLGFSFFNMQESVDTALLSSPIPPQYDSVVGSDFRWHLGSHFTLHGEGAYSEYTPIYGGGGPYGMQSVSWTAGGAANLILDFKSRHNAFTLDTLYVDPGFINYAAQTRDQDTADDFTGFMPTGDNLFNPYTGGYGLGNQSNLYFSTYNNAIQATNQGPLGGLVLSNGRQPGGLFLAPSPLNLSLPEGYATPNRAGVGGDYHGGWFGQGQGFMQPRVFGGVYAEPEVDYFVPASVGRVGYSRGGIGGSLDFSNLGLFPLKLTAGVVGEQSLGKQYVAFTTTRVAYDADYQLVRNVHLMAGFEHVDMNGGQYWNYGAGPAYMWQNYTYDDYVGGVRWVLSKAASLYVSYNFDQFNNIDYGRTDLAAAFPYLDIYSADTQTQEWEARMQVEF